MEIGAQRPLLPTPKTDMAEQDRISKVAQDFESVFLGMFVEEMARSARPKTINGGFGEEMFSSVLSNEIGKIMAESGGVGIAQSIEQSMRAYGK